MRLLQRGLSGEVRLTKDLIDNIPAYAILSHTWGLDEDEVTFDDVEMGKANSKPGYEKLQFCRKQAEEHGLEYFWVDTCCINKANYTELSEAIISMFRWYQDAAKCYVYLSDVSAASYNDPGERTWEAAFCKSRWFRRGWTLQELLAPASVDFFSREGTHLGTKKTLEALIYRITRIPITALQGEALSYFSVDERLGWTAGRETKKPEDRAYCLLAIFDISMSVRYGEGENATQRLRDKISKKAQNSTMYERPSKIPLHFETKNEPNFVGRKDEMDELERESWLCSLHTSLYYPQISARQEAIKPRHKQTCEWIFDENKNFTSTGPNFIQWLRSQDGIYWINGKAGSGKSTLMNFINEDDRLQEALDEWSKNSEVVKGSFFFWKSGTDLQKSLDGLLRSILFQILDSCPALVRIILGSFYNPRIDAEKYHWSPRKLQESFNRLLLQTRVKIFLLIDGLDEFAGEHSEIVELLQQSSEVSSTKVCLSSRPLIIFQRAFGAAPGLQVQELTKGDIMTFVKDKLQIEDLGLYISPEKRSVHQNIGNTIIEKAHGVFIWVETVVRSVQRGYFSEDSPEHLLTRIRALPPEIRDLYLPMLKDVENVHVNRQYRILEAMRFGHSEIKLHHFRISSLFIQNMDNSDKETLRPSRQGDSKQAIMEKRRRAKVQIEACCMGLIEVDGDGFLSYSHDTVREFIDLLDTKEELVKRVSIPNFSPARAFLSSAVALIELGFMKAPPGQNWDHCVLSDNNNITWCIYLAFEAARWLEVSEKCAEKLLVDRLDQAVSQWNQSYIREEFDSGRLGQAAFEYWLRRPWPEIILSGYVLGSWSLNRSHEDTLPFSDTWQRPIPLNFVGVAVRFHLRNYVEVELYSEIVRLLNKFKAKELQGPSSILLQYLRPGCSPFRNGIPDIDVDKQDVIATVRMLLRHGANPNARFGPESPWSCCLAAAIQRNYPPWPSSWAIDTALDVILMLLDSGADANLAFWLLRDRAWRSENCTTIARMSAVDVIFQFLRGVISATDIIDPFENKVEPFPLIEAHPVLKLLAKGQGIPVSELVKNQYARFVFPARVIRSRWHGLDYADQAIIDDESCRTSDMDMHFATGVLAEETIETSVDFTDGWDKLVFCGPNAARAKEAHESW